MYGGVGKEIHFIKLDLRERQNTSNKIKQNFHSVQKFDVKMSTMRDSVKNRQKATHSM